MSAKNNKNNLKEKMNEQVKNNNEIEVKEEKKSERKIRQRLDDNILVPIASNVSGGLTYKSPISGQVWYFSDYGDEDVMELRELRTMLSSSRSFLQKGWIRVLDEEIVDYLNLHRFQKEIIDPEDLDDLFNQDVNKVTEIIKSANFNTRQLIYAKAKEKYINGKLTNIHMIKAIEEGLGEKLDPNY